MAIAIAAGAARVGATFSKTATSFKKGVGSAVSASREVYSRTQDKIDITNKKVKAQKQKNEEFQEQFDKELKRREREGEVEIKKKTRSSGGFLGEFAGKVGKSFWLLLGAWAIENLPTVIESVENTIKKIRIFSAALKSTLGSIVSVSKSSIKIMVALAKNLATFDFRDKSNRIKAAQEEFDEDSKELQESFDELKNVWGREEEELDKILKDLDSGTSLTEAVNRIKTSTPAQPMTTAFGSGSTTSSSQGGWKPVLELIAKAESVGGSYDSAYPGQIKNGLSSMTIADADAWQAATAAQRGSAAAGRYQFMNILDQAKLAGLGPNDRFSPENQDKMAIALITKKRGVSLDMISDNPIEAAKRLAMEWAGLPVLSGTRGANRMVAKGQSYYAGDGLNAATISTDELQGTFTQTQQQPAQEPTAKSGGGQYELTDKVPYEQFSKTARQGGTGAVGKTSGYGFRQSPGGVGSTNHKGVDIGTSGQGNWYCAIKINGKVTFSGTMSGYGKIVIIKSGKFEYRFAHLAKTMLKQGESYSSGTPIGEIGNTGHSTGTHLHFEVLVQGAHTNPDPYLNLLEIGKLSKKVRAQSAQINGNSQETAAKVSEQVSSLRTSTNKRGRTIILRQTQVLKTN